MRRDLHRAGVVGVAAMLTRQLMAVMDTPTLARALRAELDPMTSTDAEMELLGRLERMLDDDNEASAIVAAAKKYELSADDITVLGD